MTDDKRPLSGRKRFLRLAGMTAGLAGRYAGHALANTLRNAEQKRSARSSLNLRSGKQLAQTLGELKGAVMKLGQVASQAADLLPAELAAPLQSLQKEAPPMPFSVIREQIESQFGMAVEALYAELDPAPYAAASIGQVHQGRLSDGREVVVKVQYPGVAESCDTDLAQLRFALRAAQLAVDKNVLDALFEEIRERLHEELDYLNEAANMALFRDWFACEPKIVIPDVIDELSNARVLTMCLEGGDSLSTVGENYAPELRSELAARLFRFMTSSLFEHHAVHADPNPGNFAFRPDGSLVVYDFGCIKRLEPHSVLAYRDAVRAGLNGHWEDVEDALLRLGMRVPGSKPLGEDFYGQWQPLLLQPFLHDEPFDFSQSTLHKTMLARSGELIEYIPRFQPPVRTVYLDRMVSGHYWTMVTMRAQVALGPILREYL